MLYDFPNATGGFDSIIIQVITEVPELTVLFLFFIFFVVLLGGSGLQRARTGDADYPVWSVVASLTIFITSLIMTLASGFINLTTLVIVTVITIFSGVWLFLDKRRGL